jgi:hypothetical protein
VAEDPSRATLIDKEECSLTEDTLAKDTGRLIASLVYVLTADVASGAAELRICRVLIGL